MHKNKNRSLSKPKNGILLFIVDEATLFLSHRLSIALAAKNSGYDIHVAAPGNYTAQQLIESYSLTFHRFYLSRGKNLFKELKAFLSLFYLLLKIRPQTVHLITFKPTLYGSVAARILRIPAVIATITGMRRIMFKPNGHAAKLQLKLICALYRFGFNRPRLRVTFQNSDDRDMFLDTGLITRKQMALIRGTGVNMQQFHPALENTTVPVVMLASRMRWDKGIREFYLAARQLRTEGIHARFVLVGGLVPGHPSAISEDQLQAWEKEDIVEWWGEKDDMPAVFAQAHIVCLPSYREGLPKVLIEAAACGKPIVATDVSGCRDVVEHDKNGLLISLKNPDELALALRRLITNPILREEMGQRGRKKVVNEFSIGHVVDKTLRLYESIRNA